MAVLTIWKSQSCSCLLYTSYYTGLTFKVFGDRVPDAFLSGGRYDQLFKRFGAAELTAIGWSLDIDSVYQAIHDDLPDEVGKEGDGR